MAMDDTTARPQGEAEAANRQEQDQQQQEMVPAEQVTAALEAASDFKDKMLRALAEMENLRKRTEREVTDARQYAITSFAREVLQVADNMHRALDTIGDELRNSDDAKVK